MYIQSGVCDCTFVFPALTKDPCCCIMLASVRFVFINQEVPLSSEYLFYKVLQGCDIVSVVTPVEPSCLDFIVPLCGQGSQH